VSGICHWHDVQDVVDRAGWFFLDGDLFGKIQINPENRRSPGCIVTPVILRNISERTWRFSHVLPGWSSTVPARCVKRINFVMKQSRREQAVVCRSFHHFSSG